MKNTQTTANARLTWTRIYAGRYHSTCERYAVVSIEAHSEGSSTERGWHLFDLTERDGYCNTFWTKGEAQDAAELCLADGA